MLNQLMQMINTIQNPQIIMQNIVSQNPQLQVVLNQAQASGLTPRQYVEQYAKQNNINIQPLIQMLNGRGIKM